MALPLLLLGSRRRGHLPRLRAAEPARASRDARALRRLRATGQLDAVLRAVARRRTGASRHREPHEAGVIVAIDLRALDCSQCHGAGYVACETCEGLGVLCCTLALCVCPGTRPCEASACEGGCVQCVCRADA